MFGYGFCVMEPGSRRLMRAWRDGGVANQVLGSEVLAFAHEENRYNINLRASTELVFTQIVSRDGELCS